VWAVRFWPGVPPEHTGGGLRRLAGRQRSSTTWRCQKTIRVSPSCVKKPYAALPGYVGPAVVTPIQYWPLAAYAQSKLALTMYTKSLAEAGGDSFTALSVHPGVFQTRLLPI
jgi:NAD(P)-dependent dehydrogenase (short-subunit alcohol dehydrogenase family)